MIARKSLFNELEKIALVSPGLGVVGRAANHLGGLAAQGGHAPGSKFFQGVGLIGAATQIPGALKKDDPTGQNRSRTERVLGIAGDTVGGLIGMGVGLRHLPATGVKGFLAQGLAAGAGGLIGQKAATLPFAMARRSQQDQQLRAQAKARAQAAATFPRDNGEQDTGTMMTSPQANEGGISP